MHRSLMLFTRRGHELEMSPFWSSAGCLTGAVAWNLVIVQQSILAGVSGVLSREGYFLLTSLPYTYVLSSQWRNLGEICSDTLYTVCGLEIWERYVASLSAKIWNISQGISANLFWVFFFAIWQNKYQTPTQQFTLKWLHNCEWFVASDGRIMLFDGCFSDTNNSTQDPLSKNVKLEITCNLSSLGCLSARQLSILL